MGIDKGKFVRLRSGIFYTLNKLAEAGHCYTTREQLTGRAKELLEVEEPDGSESGDTGADTGEDAVPKRHHRRGKLV